MKKFVMVAALALLLTAAILPGASAAGDVVGTYDIAFLGQGIHGGGPLYADGTGGGTLALSFLNGQVIGHLDLETWREVEPGKVELCFSFTPIKNYPPPHEACDTFSATGQPVLMQDEGFTILVRARLL